MGATALVTAMSAFAFGGANDARAHAQLPEREIVEIVRAYSIPAGRMSTALNRLADASGVLIVYDTALTRSVTTRGLNGARTLNAALEELLSGTRLGYDVAADGKTVMIVLAQNDTGVRSDAGAETLPTIDIGAEQNAPGARNGGGRGRGAGDPSRETGYTRSATTSATRTQTPLIDTPQSVQIVPREVIRDRQILNVLEAVQNVSGVQADNSGIFYDNFLIRGFSSGYGRSYRNGLRVDGTGGTVDMAFTDRVEVVKGPASMLYGRIEPGGFVNVVTKRPQEEFAASLDTQFGSWGVSRSIADVTGPVDAEKTVLYRLMGVYDRADSFVNFDHRNNGAAALYLTFRPTENFEANVQFEHYEQMQTIRPGQIPVNLGVSDQPANLPRRFNHADNESWAQFPYVVHRTVYAFDWTWRFADEWKVTNAFHYIDAHENQNAIYSTGFDGSTLSRGFYAGVVKRYQLSTNLNLIGEVDTGPVHHALLAGVDWFHYGDDWPSTAYSSFPSINVWAPSYGGVGPLMHSAADNARNNTLWASRWRNFGAYVQDQISFLDDRVHLLLGGRYDKAEESYGTTYGGNWESCYPFCSPYPLKSNPDTTPLSPRAGLLVKLDLDTSVYGSYTRSAGTNNGRSAAGDMYPPERGLQWEVGVKRLWMDGRLSTSLALFDLRKKNVLQPDPINPAFSLAVGEVTSRGIEFDIAGQITDNLSVIGSYTFNSVKITDDNDNGNVGKRYYGAAPNVGNLWVKWDTAPGAREGFEFGAGFYAMDRRYGSNDNSWYMPAYVKFDTMAAYRTVVDGHDVTFRFNVKNIGDERYFVNSNGYDSAQYGAPRTFLGQVSFKW
ncbi:MULTISPECIES: TonB-dependent siderophore receptor [Methylosinus]|uniref:TonB-dependent siderophore receptor n=1 Tax=Methylosinus trichosporium (strain ATCC 35070 / NCIMB 11131 / UNIQEM 75 / OB3b) TaxID=595536 RepID=A0A2D2CXD8_METT3|nr:MULTISPECIES: TonB-dependent receptor [Methylosinus]ATQ67428.1 TonB-dependent siderophore receptor [Methylosinus trichosporium OB3b]